jgi:hypothetical protein
MHAIAMATLLALAACGGGGGTDDTADADGELVTDLQDGAMPHTGVDSPEPTASPDLTFTPAEVLVAPGGTATMQVSVNTGADLTNARFDLPGVQSGVITSFVAAPDGHTGTLTIAASEAVEAADAQLMVKGASGVDRAKAWVGALRVQSAPALTAKTIFVSSSSGSDAADGSASHPLKTLGKAMKIAVSGDTVQLLSGTYGSSGSGDVYPIQVPSGVTLQGTLASNGAKQSFLSTSGGTADDLALVLTGDATVKDMEIDVFDVAISADRGIHTLSNINFILNPVSLKLSGAAQTTLINSEVFHGVGAGATAIQASGAAQFTMDGGQIEASSVTCTQESRGIVASGSARVNLQNHAALKNIPGSALSFSGVSTGMFERAAISRTLPAGCTGVPLLNFLGASLDTFAVTFNAKGGVTTTLVQALTPSSLHMSSTVLTGDSTTKKGNGLVLGNQTQLTFENGNIANFENGLDARSSAAGVNVSNTNFNVNLRGIRARNGLKLRHNTFAFNTRNVVFDGVSVSGDLGTAADPGGNNFFTPRTDSNIIALEVAGEAGQVQAAGNNWNFGIQGADIGGHFTPKLVGGPVPYTSKKMNFSIQNAGAKIQF